jgi:hypothetical protein
MPHGVTMATAKVDSKRASVAAGKERVQLVLTSKLVQQIRIHAIRQGMVGSHFFEALLSRGFAEWMKEQGSAR